MNILQTAQAIIDADTQLSDIAKTDSIMSSRYIKSERELERCGRQSPEVSRALLRAVEQIECLIIGGCAVGVPHEGERKVLHDVIISARAFLAEINKETT